MSVRREHRRDPKTGTTREFWMVDVDFEHADGTRTRVRKVSPVQTKRGAEQYERDIRARLLDGTYGKEEPKAAPKLADFKDRFINDHCVANKHKPSGIWGKECVFATHLLPLFGARRLDSFGPEDDVTLKARFGARSPSTYNNAACVLNTVLTVAERWKVIAQIPHRFEIFKRAPCRPKFYDFEQYDALVAAGERFGRRHHLLALLGGDAGLRRGEMIALEKSDLDFRRGLITISRSSWKGRVTATKGRDYRVIPMTKRLKAALEAHCKDIPGERILFADDGGPVSAKTLRKWMRNMQRAAKLESTTGGLHILRHTFCSHLAMKGAPALSIQKLAGHKDLRTTLGYMHLAPGETERAIRLLEAPLHGGGNLTATEVAA